MEGLMTTNRFNDATRQGSWYISIASMVAQRRISDISEKSLRVGGINLIPESHQTVVSNSRDTDEILLAASLSMANCALRTVDGMMSSGCLIRKKKGQDVQFKCSIPVAVAPQDRVLVTFWVFNEFYAFGSSAKKSEKEIIALEVPATVHRIHRRRLDRTELGSGEKFPVTLREMNGRRCLSGIAINISPVGFGIEVRLDERQNADRLRTLHQDLVFLAEIPGISARNPTPARVVHFRMSADGSTAHLGIACIVPIAVGDEPSLEDFLLEHRYPDVVRARTDEDYEKIWRMLFNLDKVVHVDASRKESSIATWKKSSWSPAPLHRIYLLRNPENPAKTRGTLSVSRFYSKTWLIHQLAVDGTRGRVLSHQLYGRVLDFLRQTEEVKFTVGTWSKDARVFQKYYLDFIHADPDPSNHYLEQCSYLEFPVTDTLQELEKSPMADYVMRPFDYTSQGEILRFLRGSYPPIFLEALDLDEYRMCLEDVHDYYGRVALQRNREILLAHKPGGGLAGFALVEYGSPNQNIFSLFDNFRLFPLVEGLEAAMVRKELLRAAMQVYARVGIPRATIWTADQELERSVSCCSPGIEVYFWIANTRRIKAFLRHLDRLHGRMSTMRATRDERETLIHEDSSAPLARPVGERM